MSFTDEVMRIELTTIGEAARGRLAQWTVLSVRSKEGSRSLPGSPRFTDRDMRSAPNDGRQRIREGAALLAETARPSREDVSRFRRGQLIGHRLWQARTPPPPPWLTFLSVFPQVGGRTEAIPAGTRRISNSGSGATCRGERKTNDELLKLLDNTHKS